MTDEHEERILAGAVAATMERLSRHAKPGEDMEALEARVYGIISLSHLPREAARVIAERDAALARAEQAEAALAEWTTAGLRVNVPCTVCGDAMWWSPSVGYVHQQSGGHGCEARVAALEAALRDVAALASLFEAKGAWDAKENAVAIIAAKARSLLAETADPPTQATTRDDT